MTICRISGISACLSLSNVASILGVKTIHGFALLCLLVSACKEPIRTYRVAVEPNRELETASPGALPRDIPSAPSPQVVWQAKAGWEQEPPGQFLKAAYRIPGVGRLTVSTLPGDGGGLAENVNRWREQVQLPRLPDSEIQGQSMTVNGSDHELLLFNLTADQVSADTQGIFAAILPLEKETWYFKITAPANLLRESGASVFTAFLGTVRVVAATDGKTEASTTTAKPQILCNTPEGWESGPAGSMRAASFTIRGSNGATADVSVIPLGGNSGTRLENVNRWRSQVQLPPLSSENDPALGEDRDSVHGKIFFTQMVSEQPVLDGRKVALSAAILRRGDITWFFKITGEADLVQNHREKFLNFVGSSQFP